MAINKVGSKGIEDGSVASADFAPNTVTSAKLQDNAVTNAKLTNSSVTLAGSSVSLGGSVSFNNKFIDWQSVITADGSTGTTAVSGQGYFIDTTSDVHTVTLPASASIGDFIAIKDYAGTFGTNNLTIARNGHNIQGVANDSLISTNRASLVLVYVDSTKGWLYWEEHNVADLQALGFISATGGTVTTSGDYKIHTFTGDGCFVVSSAGLGPGTYTNVDYLVIAGGGGGGGSGPAGPCNASGAGGGGGFREAKQACGSPHTTSPLAATTGITVSATTYPITVGAGGSAGGATGTPSGHGSSGSNSIFSTITSAGGGGGGSGGSICAPTNKNAFNGGSGGGGGDSGTGGSGNTPPVSPSQGNPGAAGSGGVYGGGGGGAGTAGSGQTGGSGSSTSITASPVTYSAGGTGSVYPSPSGSPQPANSGNGAPSGSNAAGGNGGKGIVIIRYKFQ